MGSSMSAIYDNYDDYVYFCEVIGVEPVDIYAKNNFSFYDHESQLLKELGFKSKYDYYEMLRKAKLRDEAINSILDD